MCDSIYLGVSVVFPLLFYMMIGVAVKKLGWVSDKTLAEMNRLVFRVLMSVMVFLNAYTIDIGSAFSRENVKVLLLCIAAMAAIFFAAVIGCRKFVREKTRKAVLIQGIYRSNLALFGLPVSTAICGEGNLSTISILIAVIVPIFNIIAAILLNWAKDSNSSVGGISIMAFTNPLVFGSVLGLACSLINLPLAELILTPLTGLSKAATPLAFIVLGGSLVVESIKKDLKSIFCVCLIRLVLVPCVVLGGAIAMGICGPPLVAMMVVFASPIAVSSYTMAKEMEVSPDLAGELVAVTTIISMITMFMWIAVLDFCKYI